MTRQRRGCAIVVTVGVVSLLATACSDDGDGAAADTSTAVTICEPTGTAQADTDLPQVAAIATAIDALETQLGGPQQYFEVNATARVVNLFVALNGGTIAQPWVYLDGALTSQEGQQASGGTFAGADLDVDPDLVLTKVREEIPDAILESFYVNGDGEGNVQYGVLTSALCGGGLDIVVGPDGEVLSVDPVQ